MAGKSSLAPVSACKRPAVSRQRRLLILAPLLVVPLVALAQAGRVPTPAQALGPFYPLRPDPSAGSDLATVDGARRARGVPLAIIGRLRDTAGRPQPDILVEIWQTNAHGRYHHPHDDSPLPLDPDFRGYGRATSDGQGAYRFTTIKPVAYPGRTPHVHFRLSRAGTELLVTQMYLPDAAGANARDGLFRHLDEGGRRQLVGVPEPGVLATLRFDIVVRSAR